MTHRRRWLLAGLACFVAALCAGPTAIPLAATEGLTVVAHAYRENRIQAGDPLQVLVTVGSEDPSLTVTLDTAGVANDGFVQRLIPSEFTFCPNGNGCLRCPAGHRCFQSYFPLRLAFTIVGRVEMPIVVTEGSGRITRATLGFDVFPFADRDADGMPDTWELEYGLSQTDPPGGPDGDADGDGVSNLDEFRRGTNPSARYARYFAEASPGERAPGLEQCFTAASLAADRPGGYVTAWLTLIGDDGRRLDTFSLYCPEWRRYHAADRIVAAIVESREPLVVERTAIHGAATAGRWIGSTGLEAPSTRWFFADGGGDALVDTFYLFYNPSSRPVDVTMTYRRDDGRVLSRRVHTLPPRVRTTVWVNADDAAVSRSPSSAAIDATAPVLVERAWRFDPPGRSASYGSASAGVTAPSARWIFPDVDDRTGLESTIVVANPSTREAIVDVSLLFGGADERPAGAVTLPPGGRAALPARQLVGLAGRRASIEVVSRNGVGVVAERTILGHDDAGPWRVGSAGASAPGVVWVLPNTDQARDLVIANVAAVPARVELVFNPQAEEPLVRVLDVPARQRLVYPVGAADRTSADHPSRPGPIRVTSQPTAVGAADIVVELVRRIDGGVTSSPRAAGIIAARVR